MVVPTGGLPTAGADPHGHAVQKVIRLAATGFRCNVTAIELFENTL